MEIVCTLIAYREFESPPLRQISRGYWKTVTPFCFCAIVPPVAVSLHAGLSVATAKGRNHIHSFNTASCRAPNEFLEPTHFFAAQCRRASLFLQHLGWPHAGRMACAHRPAACGVYTKDGGKPFNGQFFRLVSDQFPSHFSSTKRAHAGGSFRNCGSHTHAAGSTSFCGESLQ